MTLNASGPISLAGTTTGQSIEIEVTGNGTTQISLNDTNVRTLAGVSSGAISMPTDFWGKTYGIASVSALLVGGGGGGSCGSRGGGGGGGNVHSVSFSQLTPGTYSVVVGNGGLVGQVTTGAGTVGGTSSFNSQYAYGGGGGAGQDGSGYSGCGGGGSGGTSGSGGTGSYSTSTNGAGGSAGSGGGYAGGYGTCSQGSGGWIAGGGGAGAGASGGNAVQAGRFQDNIPGNGGNGVASSITGSSVYYGGGGGGMGIYGGGSNAYGSGGLGGGGSGSNGTNGLGGGGGSGIADNSTGTGGSGVVIISYQSATQKATGGTVTSYGTGASKYWVHKFTSNGNFVI